jgi:hypothetical protein
MSPVYDCLCVTALAAKLGIGSAAGTGGGAPLLRPLVMPVVTEETMQQTMVLQMQLKAVGDRLVTVRCMLPADIITTITITIFCSVTDCNGNCQWMNATD